MRGVNRNTVVACALFIDGEDNAHTRPLNTIHNWKKFNRYRVLIDLYIDSIEMCMRLERNFVGRRDNDDDGDDAVCHPLNTRLMAKAIAVRVSHLKDCIFALWHHCLRSRQIENFSDARQIPFDASSSTRRRIHTRTRPHAACTRTHITQS